MNRSPIRAVITGASSGIGREIAIHFARQCGSQVPGISERLPPKLLIHFRRNEDGAEETAAAAAKLGAATKIVRADIRVEADRLRLTDQAWEWFGTPTSWINNAGADVLTGANANLSFADKLRVLIETDVLGTIELTRAVVDRLKATITDSASLDHSSLDHSAPPPSITFIGWDQAPLGMEGDAGQMFGPVKAAVMAFSKSLAQQTGPEIRVNTVAPGWIKTAWGETTDEYWDGRAKSQALMNRWGTPQDVAKAVWFVADPENTFCSGQVIPVNGGWNRRHPT